MLCCGTFTEVKALSTSGFDTMNGKITDKREGTSGGE